MKNLKLNLKGLYGYRQSLLSRSPQPRDNREMSERRPSEERTLLAPVPQRFARYAAMLIMLLTLGVGQMWADNAGFFDTGAGIITYSKNSGSDTNHTVNKTGVSTSDFGTVTAFWLKGWQFKMWKNNGGNVCDYGKMYYRIYLTSGSGGAFTELDKSSTTWWPNSTNHVYHNGGSLNTNLLSGLVGGVYYFEFYFKAQGNWNSGSGCDDQYLSNGNSNYKIKFKYDPKYTVTVSAGSNGSVASTSVTAGNIDAVTLPTATANTGYHFNNWTTASSNLTLGSTTSATGGTVKARAAGTVTANFAANTYTVAYNANDAQYPGTATGSTSSSSHTYGTAKALTSNGFSRAGYTFAGWATTPTGSVAYTNGQSVTNLTSTQGATVTLYAKWTENKSTITLVASPSGKGTFQVGGETVTSTQAGVTTTPSVTAYPISGYRFTGWSISGGASISSTSDNPTTVTGGGAGTAATLTATFEENLVYYDVTFGVGTSYTSLGSLSATNNTTSSAISSGDDILSASSITFTATPNTGYVVEGWYTDAACTAGKHDAGSTTYTIASLSSDVTVYVKFVEKTWSVAFAAGTGGTVTTPAATPQTVGQLTGISIAATPATGYTFNTWTITSGSGSFTSAATTNSNKFKPTAASTITASFNETMSSLSTSCHYDAGNPSYAAPTVSGSATNVGYATTRTITATAAGTGYTFAGWTLTNCTRTDGGAATATSITIRSNGDGAAATVVANYNEVLTTSWYIAGDGNGTGTNLTPGSPFSGWGTSGTRMSKKTGHSTEEVYYCTITVSTVATTDDHFPFKVYNSTGSQYYGNNGYWVTKENNHPTLSSTSGSNMKFRPYVTGTYEFKLDNTGANPVLTVTWPVYNQVRISAASPSDAGNVGNYDLSEPVSNVRTVTRSLKANTTYTFKVVYNSDWYGHSTGTFTRSNSTSSNLRTLETSSGNLTLTTDYAGDYTFKFNQSTKALSVDFPEAYKVTYGKGAVDGSSSSCSAKDIDNGNVAVTSNSTWVKSGNRVVLTAPAAKSGYTYDGWFSNNAGTGDAITPNANCTITVSSAETYYACYHENLTAVTITTDGHGTITTPNPNESPYSLGVATMQNINASANTGYHWNTWTVSGTAALNSSAATQSNKAKGDGTVGGTGTVTATFSPNTYRVHFHRNGGAGETVYQNFTYDVAQNLTANSYTKTGYSFAGWALSTGGDVEYANSANVSNLTAENGVDFHLYAKWTPNPYTVVLDKQTSAEGYGSAGTVANQTVTFDATPATVSGTMPSAANGYAFMGFYSATGGNGRLFIDPSGNWVTSAGDTISGGKWVKPAGITLYAYYKKAEITGITFTDGAVVPPSTSKAVSAVIEPTPTGTTTVCWRVLYSNDNPLDPQPAFTPVNAQGTSVSFTAPATSGMYKMEAVLHLGSGCEGEEVSTYVTTFQVAGDHTVTVQYKCGDETIAPSTTVTGRPLVWSEVVAHDIFGYTFSGWTAGDGITIEDAESGRLAELQAEDPTIVAVTKMKAIYDGRLTANYTQNQIIYFKNTLGWENVYVNFHTGNAWSNTDNGSGSPKGVGNSGLTNANKHMTRIGDTDVWYYDYGYNNGGSSISPSLYISFTDLSRPSASEFWGTNPGINVVYPANYADALSTDKSSENGFKAATPMFVPLSGIDPVAANVGGGGKANYYNRGYWTKYTAGTGYTLEIYYDDDASSCIQSIPFTSEDDLMPMSAVVDLEASTTYRYQVRRGGTSSAGIYYGNTGTMTYADHGVGTGWIMENTMAGGFKKAKITTNASGNYTFNLSYSPNASNEYRLRMEVDYPIADGDYRLIYTDATRDSGTRYKPSAIVTKANNSKDTVSFFVRPGSTPVLKIQQASVTKAGVITWGDLSDISSSVTSLPKDSVYNICLTMDGSGVPSVESVVGYTGNFYIRTNAAGASKWDNYRSSDHLMTYSEYSETYSDYTHYFMAYVGNGTNVKFVVANDYSPCISDTLVQSTFRGGDSDHVDASGNIQADANVRFMWNRSNNAVYRAYLAKAQSDGTKFLVLRANSSTDLMDENGNPLTGVSEGTPGNNHGGGLNCMQFTDNQNWIYEANVKVKPGAFVKLYAHFHGNDFYYRGNDNSSFDGEEIDGTPNAINLITGNGDAVKVRVVYDFKTDRLLAAWMPEGEIDESKAINADVMFVREGQGDIAQLTFTKSGEITAIKTAYGVMKFNKWTLNNKDKDTHTVLSSPASIYERSLFWISFPFRVKLNEVFGFGTYGVDWAIQRYDGAERAEKGFWLESSGFWKWMDRNTEYLEPNQGYLLAIDLDLLGESASVWDNGVENVELYFPSYGTMPSITSAAVVQTLTSHQCEIDRSGESNGHGGTLGSAYNRTVIDSHWNVMSVPTYVNTASINFANTEWITAGDGKRGPNFLYTWNPDDNTLTATAGEGYTYHAMHAYMVQYCGNVTWTASSGSPYSPIVARRTYAEQPKKVNFCLEIQQNEKMIDRTFVQLSNDEEVSAEFSFGEDMGKEFNSRKANIYTVIENYLPAAGNTLPMSEQTTLVPVGVKTTAAGEYTFAMPEGTNGVSVVLIDNIAGTRTNLALFDYTVALGKGDLSDRFMLEIAPIKQMPTGIEAVSDQHSAVRKMMIDGILYIVKDGKVFDAHGSRVK